MVAESIVRNLIAITLAIERTESPGLYAGFFCSKLNRQLRNLEAYTPMARQNGKSNRSNTDYVQPKFANVRLSKTDKAEFDLWVKGLTLGGYDAITDFAQDGYKTSFTMDKDGKSFIASTTCTD